MDKILASRWVSAFFTALHQDPDVAVNLREAALREELARWTAALTALVVDAFASLGMPTAAKGHRCGALPVGREEYLGQDVMAFSASETGWQLPQVVCELENSAKESLISYSLWKVLCVRCELRVVFCYRAKPTEAVGLVSALAEQVIAPLDLGVRQSLGGETLVIVGSRAEANTFPNAFFSLWKLNLNTGRFERFARP